MLEESKREMYRRLSLGEIVPHPELPLMSVSPATLDELRETGLWEEGFRADNPVAATDAVDSVVPDALKAYYNKRNE